MPKLTRNDLFSLEQYAEVRADFRAQVINHKKNRRLALDSHHTLYFEDALTVKYQVQEMLRIERIFEAAGIAEELEAYNPLIPDGANWKATYMVEYADETERKTALAGLIGVEDRIWMQVGSHAKVYAIADEDLDRSSDEKTSAVHFLRFELTPAMVTSVKVGETLTAGIEHAACPTRCVVPENVRLALAADLT
jgi:hypothetical protein